MNILTYIMRGGESADIEREEIEKNIQEHALQNCINNPSWAKKGLRWSYNLTWFYTFYGTKDARLLKYLYSKRPYPEMIEVETTTICDMNCDICENTHWKHEPKKHMKFEEFKFIIDQFPDLKWIGMTGMGQSFLNPDYVKMVDYVKSKNVYVEIYDSFLHLDSEKSKHLVEIGFDKICVSLDAATKETYLKIRRNGDWEKVLKNIKTLDGWKKKLNSSFPELFFHFIITKNNIGEMKAYLDLIDSLGVNVSCVQYTRMLHEFPEIKHLFVEVPEDLKKEVINYGKELGINVIFNTNTNVNKPPMSGCSVWFQPFIFVDGTVVPCCSLNEQNDRDWQRSTSLGNVFKEDFRKIWSENYKPMLDKLVRWECPVNCERCVLMEVPK